VFRKSGGTAALGGPEARITRYVGTHSGQRMARGSKLGMSSGTQRRPRFSAG
jgi:hypothetical protein